MRKIMILGAGIYQLPLILQAKKMGLYTIVVSRPGNYPGFDAADKVYEVDTKNSQEILAIAQKEEIDGICTTGTDVAVKTIGFVCSHMKLAGIGEEAASVVTNKRRMKEAFVQHGVSTADFEIVQSQEEAKAALERLGFPAVIKAVDNSGSRGVIRVNSMEEVNDAYLQACHYTDMPYLLIEEFIDALEIGIDAFVLDHTLCLMLPHDKYVYSSNQVTIPVGHHFPYSCSPKLLEVLTEQMQRAIIATGMNDCPINADVFVKGDQAFVIEVGGRSGATCIPELISMHCGFNYYEKMIRAALGEHVDFSFEQQKPCMAKLIFSKKSGVVTDAGIEILEELKEEGVSAQMDYPVGTRVHSMKNGTDRIGHVIAPTNDEDILEEVAKRLRKNIWIDRENLEELWRE